VADTNFTEQYNPASACFALTDFSSQFNKEHLNVSPLNIRTGWACVDQFEWRWWLRRISARHQ
jgi:hypothetical protein